MSGRLDGRVAIVTGAARGIGYGIAERLITEGAKVAIADINAEGAAETASELNAKAADSALAIAQHGLTLSPASARGHLETGLLHFGRYALTVLPPYASSDFQQAIDAFSRSLNLEPWRSASHKKVARMLLPLWSQCSESQQHFIKRVARRAVEMDPDTPDLSDAITKLGT